MSATIKDVAREAGVASGTISKYLNGGSVRPENKKNIEEAIRRLEYRPNSLARGLRNSRSYRIAFLLPGLGRSSQCQAGWQLLKNMCGRWAAF